MPDLDEYMNEIAPLWESHWLTNMGVEHDKLEEGLKSYLDAANIALFTNGHSALECVYRGDEPYMARCLPRPSPLPPQRTRLCARA